MDDNLSVRRRFVGNVPGRQLQRRHQYLARHERNVRVHAACAGCGDVDTVGTMPLLGGGTIMGVFEMAGMFLLLFVLVAMPASQEMKPQLLLLALAGSFYFTMQALLFSRAPSEFLYFQF